MSQPKNAQSANNMYMCAPMPLADSLREFARRGEQLGATKENVALKLHSFRTRDIYALANTPAQDLLFEQAIPILERIAELDHQTEVAFEELRTLLGVQRGV